MSDDTPTQRFEQPAISPSGAEPHGGDVTDPEKKPRGMLILVVVIGAALLAAIIVILVLLLAQTDGGRALPTTATTATASSSPSSSTTATATVTPPSPSLTATAAPAPAPRPPGTNVLITSFTINPTKIDCSAGAPAGSGNLSISWKSVNGSAAYFGVNTADAKTGGMGWTLPASGTQHDFPTGYDPFDYTCASASVTYTITVTGSGSQQSQTITVYRQ